MKWLFLFFITFAVACTPTTHSVRVQACPPRPIPPVFKQLNSQEQVCSRSNETIKATNASGLRAYAEKLDALIDCYESQVTDASAAAGNN